MILAFASDDDKGLDGVLSYHFGRCPYYTFVEIEGNEVKNVTVEPNPAAESHNPGEIPQFIASKKAEVIFAGGMGPRAQEWFTQLGVKPIINAYGRIKDLISQFLGNPVNIPEGPHTLQKSPPYKENEEIDRLKKELSYLREVVADLNTRLRNLEVKMED